MAKTLVEQLNDALVRVEAEKDGYPDGAKTHLARIENEIRSLNEVIQVTKHIEEVREGSF